MTTFITTVFILSGFNFLFWILMGLGRFLHETGVNLWQHVKKRRGKISLEDKLRHVQKILPEDVAVIIPAHNEELVIGATIESLKRVVASDNIYIGSDASTDRTVKIARDLGCNVVDVWPNKGKAGILDYLIRHFRLRYHYKAVMIVDADVEVDENYLTHALPFFNDPDVGAVAVHAKSKWFPHILPRPSMLYAAYRTRLYRIIQATMRYGQTWQYTNATFIVPGFASVYRSSILADINITAPGLIIEDYNMTFELRHKKLGKVAYSPFAFSSSEDPHTLKDYIKQMRRWNLGLWQTIRRHGFWPSFFSVSLGMFITEMLYFSLFFLAIPAFVLWFVVHGFEPMPAPLFAMFVEYDHISFLSFAVSILLIDYFFTVITAVIDKKPVLLFYGLFFLPLRYIDAIMFLYTLPLSFIVESNGRWTSPQRLGKEHG